MRKARVPEPFELPDSVEELYPAPAARLEELRSKILALLYSWGYRYVVPPLLEYAETAPQNRAVDLADISIRFRDGMSPWDLALRADFTLQTARMDALDGNGNLNRYCYAGSVVHSRPRDLLSSREPFQVGAELYGSETEEADCEVMLSMAESIYLSGVRELCLDLGHAGIYHSIAAAAELPAQREEQLFSALQRKAVTEIERLTDDCANREIARMLCALPTLHGGYEVLEEARRCLDAAPVEVARALDRLEYFAQALGERKSSIQCYFDLAELRGYRYHTGVVFAAYAGESGAALANGGRCDGIGAAYGRARPAVGFNTDLRALLDLRRDYPSPGGILAPINLGRDTDFHREVSRLRKAGERVVVQLPDEKGHSDCTQILRRMDGDWRLMPLEEEE